ncbi:DEAD/DEAH box helicase [Deinococcus misasensis]|uniref:DEAD/DEAH box helicase n=1 Tax=Deinococcus misasensis TaxID=392413 RepID=UPI00068F5177|nr:DEAD/DEAH box helicase [Deinococcus misasensis]
MSRTLKTPRSSRPSGWSAFFEPNDWQAGMALYQEGGVIHCRHFEAQSTLEGEVRDVVEVFRVKLLLQEDLLEGQCTCRRDKKKKTCRHMAAVMHHHLSPPPQARKVSGLTEADHKHLERMVDSWKLQGQLHEAFQLKLQALYHRAPADLQNLLKAWNAMTLLKELDPEIQMPSEPEQTPSGVLQLGNITLSVPAPPPLLAQTANPEKPPATPILAPNRPQPRVREKLAFALDLGRGKPNPTYPRLIPMVGTLRGGQLQDPKVYVQGKNFVPSRQEGDLLYRMNELKAQQRLRHTPETDKLLEDLLDEGILFLQDHWGRFLDDRETREGHAFWHEDEKGHQYAQFRTDPESKVLILHSVWFVDMQTLQMGKVNTKLQPHQLTFFLGLQRVTADQVPQVQQSLKNLGPEMPLPREMPFDELEGKPEPHLVISAQDWSIGPITAPVPHATLTLSYLGEKVPAKTIPPLERAVQGLPPLKLPSRGTLTVVKRDVQAEQGILQTLIEQGFHALKGHTDFTLPYRYGKPGQFVPEPLWLHLLQKVVPELQAQGWNIEMDRSFPFRVIQPRLEARIVDEEGWFTLDLGVEVEGQNVSLLPMLIEWMETHPEELKLLLSAQGDALQEYLPVGQNIFVKVDMLRLRSILRLLSEFYQKKEEEGQSLRLPRMAAGLLSELQEHPHLEWHGGQEVLALAKSLGQLTGKKRPKLPASLQDTLRPYQREGVGWLQALRKTGTNGILADDMGLGKTLQTLTHLQIEKEAGRLKKPVLVVAPTSLMRNWLSETEKFTPELQTLLLHGPARRKLFGQIKEADVVFTTYALLHRDIEHLKEHTYHTIILDEAQYIKNHKNQTSQALLELSSKHKLCLTGTPMENHLGELWSLFRFLMPGLLPKESEFRSFFRQPIEKEQDAEKQMRLSRMVKPLMLRRTKNQVARDLPEKTEITLKLELEGDQRDVYEVIRVAMQERLQHEIQMRGLARSQIHVLDALLKLRQVCCDPRLLKMEEASKVQTSVKMQWLKDTVPSMLEEGRTILLFSQFTSMLALIEQELQELSIDYALLTGSTSDRQEQIQKFQSGQVKVFLISLKAGGVGLNLTAADTVIHFDPWWNPAAENQATDRAYRIGQDKPVFVYKLVTEGTIEEKILGMQRFKAALAAGILEGTLGEGLKITEEDIKGLFGP